MCGSGLPVLIHDEEQSLRLHCQHEAETGRDRGPMGSCKEPVPSHLMRARSSQAKRCRKASAGFGRLRPALSSCLQHAAQCLHGRLRGLAVGDEDQRGGKERSNLKTKSSPSALWPPPSPIPRSPASPAIRASRGDRHDGMALGHGIVTALAIKNEKMSGMTGHRGNINASATCKREKEYILQTAHHN